MGVVGPTHSGGNAGILTYDFVHRTHVNIFGFYYPRLFTDWWGDDWITHVYQPGRSTKLHKVRLTHTLELGSRYGVRDGEPRKKLPYQLDLDIGTLQRPVQIIIYDSTFLALQTNITNIISCSGMIPRMWAWSDRPIREGIWGY